MVQGHRSSTTVANSEELKTSSFHYDFPELRCSRKSALACSTDHVRVPTMTPSGVLSKSDPQVFGTATENLLVCVQEASNPKDDAAYFESLSFFVSKVRGEHFSWEQARDMTFKDIAKNVEMYHAMLSRLFEQGAENPDSPAHAELVELLALKVLPMCLTPCGPAEPSLTTMRRQLGVQLGPLISM